MAEGSYNGFKTNIPKGDPPTNIPKQEIPKSVLEKQNHPMGYRNNPPIEKEEKGRYSFYSDIQEMQDRIQTLYASGSSFAEQKTIDISESEYRMLPFEMLKIANKNILFILATYLIGALVFWASSYFDIFKGVLYPLPLSVFFFSLMFYAYVVYGMKQFVIEDEKQPKTKQFYKIIISSWRAVEVFLLLSLVGILILLLKIDFLLSLLPHYRIFENINFYEVVRHLMLLSLTMNACYFGFTYFVNKKFKKIQKENMLALYAQYNRTEAINKRLEGEL